MPKFPQYLTSYRSSLKNESLKKIILFFNTTTGAKLSENNIDKQKEQSKDKTLIWKKETQMTRKHETLWKPELIAGAPEG